MTQIKPIGSTCCVISIAACITQASAQPGITEPQPAEASSNIEAGSDFTETPIGQLDDELGVLFEDFDVVVTAGRRAQSTNKTGVPVSILDADQIHGSGATSVPDLLSFVPGVDVLQIDRNRYAVGVRGFHHEFSDRTLVLVDGRNAGSGLFGGVDFQRFPLFIEDLNRVEIVRGPGGAVWGANAFNGVINIITKDPRDTQGVLFSTQINEFGDVYTQARWGASKNKIAWRISAGWEDQESSEDAILGNDFSSRDFAEIGKVSADAVYEIDPTTTLQFGIGHSSITRGDFSFLNVQVGEDDKLDYTRAYASYDSELDADSSLKIDAFATVEDVDRPSLWRYGLFDAQIDAQYEVSLENHQLSFGGSGRVVQIDSNPDRADMVLRDETFDEQWAGLFAVDRWQASSRWQIETQARIDYYSGTTTDWSARLAGLYSVDPEDQHVIRFAAAKAFRAPQAAIREIETSRILLPTPPFPANTFGAELFRAGDLNNEQIYSLEAGYFGRLAEGLTIRADGYFQFYEDLTGAIVFDDPFAAGRVLARIDNLGGAESYGTELELALENERMRLSAWYSYSHLEFTSDMPDQNTRAFTSPDHSIGLTASHQLNDQIQLFAKYRYNSTTPADSVGTGAVPEHHRLDLSATWSVFNGQGEVAVGVHDIFDETRLAIDAVGSPGSEFETPGRAFWLRLQVQF